MCVCVCVCNVSVVCVEIYYFKSSCLPYIYNACICFILPSLQFFVCYLTASLCVRTILSVHVTSVVVCLHGVQYSSLVVWVCACMHVCACVHCVVYGTSVFVWLHGSQQSKLVVCVCVRTAWCISQVFRMPAWIAVFQFSCVCLHMCLCTLRGVHRRCFFVVACMDCNIPI